MKVTVNGQEVDLFSGAKVRDALRRLSRLELEAAEKGERKVFDRWDNEVGLDGELTGGERLQTK